MKHDRNCTAAVILAGGLSMRLRPFSLAVPKPLMPIGEESLIEQQIRMFVANGITKIFVATNYKSSYIERFLGNGNHLGADVIISKEDSELGTLGPLTLIIDELPQTFFLINGDILTGEKITDITNFHSSKSGELTVCIKEITTPFNFGQIEIRNESIVSLKEKPIFRTNVLAGMYVLEKNLLFSLTPNVKSGIDELILDLIQRNDIINAYELKKYWNDIGQLETLAEVQDIKL